ncbi:MAG TPA: MFS transporter [Oculatellaceae cyanobacterium]
MVQSAAKAVTEQAAPTVMSILLALSLCHLLNDMLQSLLPAIYPILKQSFNLSFEQIGMITLTNQVTASLLQPVVGSYTDKHPKPYSLAIGMCVSCGGLLWLSHASHYFELLSAAAMIGIGSSIFHPESSRMARTASGGQHGFAQSLFQVGGNAGTAIGPLLAAYIILPHGQSSIAIFCIAAFIGIAVLTGVGRWYARHISENKRKAKTAKTSDLPRNKVIAAIVVLCVLVFSKYFYMSSIINFYTFYLIKHFGVSVQSAQVHLFIFLAAIAVGTFAGGPIGDRIGRKYVIWASILGVLPFTLLLPYVNLFWTGVLSATIGVILASAFSAILVYAQELIPGRVGTIAGLFFGLAFGLAGVAAATLGKFADIAGIETVYRVCAFLPALGMLTIFLPNLHKGQEEKVKA